MFTFIAVALRILVNPLSNVFQKRICNSGQPPLFITFLTYLGISAVTIPAAYSIPWFTFPFAFWIYSVLIGVLAAFGNGFLVKAVRSGELSVLGPINAYKSIVGIIFGIILLGEIPNVAGLLGVALIVGGSYYALDSGSATGHFLRNILLRSDVRDRIVSMIFSAIEAVFIKKIILYSDVQTAFVVWCWGGAVFAFIFFPLWERHNEICLRSEWKRAYAQFLCYAGLICSVGLTQGTTYYVFAHMPVGYALALFQLSAVLTVFYGWLFFYETKIYQKLAASVITILGSVLIILWN
ncbi:MAG: DMT family transporter [Planctomycetaceae bacterium]|jgi:drug/metabolite transporter (DMT)-like permease|nr:DMT family transporter [Planctomycetaceae bacterium]